MDRGWEKIGVLKVAGGLIKPHSPSTSGHEPHTRGHEGVGWGETNNEVKESALIRSVKGTCDYHG